MNNKVRKWPGTQLFLGLSLLIIGIAISWFLIWKGQDKQWAGLIAKGPIGDFIAGTVGPVINLIGAVLVYLSFREQFKANKEQWKRLDDEVKIRQKLEIENRIFELIRLHQFHAQKLNHAPKSQEQSASQGVVAIISQLEFYICELHKLSSELGLGLTKSKIIKYSWEWIMFGLPFKGFDSLINYLQKTFNLQINDPENAAYVLRNSFRPRREPAHIPFDTGLTTSKLDSVSRNTVTAIRNSMWDTISNIKGLYQPNDPKYIRFSLIGHQQLLSNYFRNLFFIVNYINNIPPLILTYYEKYELVKALRVQLSNEELKLLFYGSFWERSTPWEFKYQNLIDSLPSSEKIITNKKYQQAVNHLLITKYRLIKNLSNVILNANLKIDYSEYYPAVIYDESSDVERAAARLMREEYEKIWTMNDPKPV